MEPYWRIEHKTYLRRYRHQLAEEWIHLESADGSHFLYLPLDSPELKVPASQVLGRYIIDCTVGRWSKL